MYRRRKKRGKTNIRRAILVHVNSEENCRPIKAIVTCQVEARPYAVKGILGDNGPAPLMAAGDPLYLRYSCPSTLNLSTRAAI